MRVWTPVVLSLLFAVEVTAWATYGVWGATRPMAWLWLWLLPLLVILVWGLTASPRAPWRGPLVTPVVKVAVFAGAVVLLWLAGYPVAAATLGVMTAGVHAMAVHPHVRATMRATAPPDQDRSQRARSGEGGR